MVCPNACYKRQDRRTWQKQGEYANMGSAPQHVTGHIKTAAFMQKLTIYHNPRCSKSRQALEIIRQHGIEPDVIFYLQEPSSLLLCATFWIGLDCLQKTFCANRKMSSKRILKISI